MDMVDVGGVELAVETRGQGPPLVLVHGFPHTGRVWEVVADELVADHLVAVPDLRGFGASTPTDEGLDAATLAADLEGLLERHPGIRGAPATLVALDAGVPPAFLLGMRRPELLRRLVLVESTLGPLPGAAFEPPWWFGFHQVPGLAERVLAGNEAEYVGWFYDQGTRGRGVRPDLRAALGAAFARPGALHRALGVYRAVPDSGRQLLDAVQGGRLRVPTTAVGASPVGPALADQLRPVTDRLEVHQLSDCGHIVPVDRPEALIEVLRATDTV